MIFSKLCEFLQGRSTPLHAAARNGYFEAVKMLLKFKADVNTMDEVNTILYMSLYCQYTVALQKRDTPLHDAAWAGHVEVIEALLNSGAKIDATNNVRIYKICIRRWY